MFPSVNWQKINVLAALVSLLQCRRRKDAAISPPSQKRAARQGARKKHTSANLDDSDDTQKSTDISGSTREPSTDGSDVDSPTSLKVGRKDANMIFTGARSPPGLAISPPPGLEAPPGLENPTRTGLENLGAKGARARYPKKQLSESVDEQPLSALKEVISKLSPQDAAVVRSFLLAKEGEKTTAPMQLNRDVLNAHALRNEDCHRARVYANRADADGSWRNAIGAQREPREARSRKTTARQQPPGGMGEDADSLRTNLRDLAALDSDRVVMVRRINRLGLDAAAELEAYFSQFGTIDRLMVNNSCCKSASGATRVRPATVGFLVMSTVEEAQAVKAFGEEHVVQGSIVKVANFQSHPVDE